ALVAGEVGSAGNMELDKLWQRAVELREAEALGEKGELDRVLDEWLAKGKELPPKAAILVSASRLLGSAPDVGRIAETLSPLVDGADAALGGAAARLVADKTFKSLPPSKRDQLANRMLERAEDGALAPRLRLDFAKSAYLSGGGKERLKANEVLRTFLSSQDPELKAEGALAMAELDAAQIEGALRATLERLAKVPDQRGLLASSYLQREELRRQHERARTDLLKSAEKSAEMPEVQELLAVLRLIKNRHLDGQIVEQERLFEEAINGMLGYMDPHSSLLTSEQYAKFFGELEAEYGGIGAYVNADPDDGLFTIVKPIYSGPAYRQGLMTDDKIVRIDDWPTLGEPVDDIIKHLKGKPGTTAQLYVWRHGMDSELIQRPSEDMKVTVVRQQVRIPPGTFQMLPGGIGLVQLDEFSQVAMEEAKDWIEQLLALGMKAMVLDLRFNGGGLLPAARDVAELFLPRGKDVVSTEGTTERGRREKVTLTTEALTPVLPAQIPLVVLVGSGTASAAEIVSGALQDHGRAKLVGKTTYGKGSVQQLIKLDGQPEDGFDDEDGDGWYDSWEKLTLDHDGDGEMDYAPRVKLTVARYLLPFGRSIHREVDREGRVISEGGVKPDIVISSPSIEGWRLQEQRRILPLVKKHVEETYAANRELYGQLSVNDQKRTDLYPGFEQLRAGLDTTLSPDDVRRVLRYQTRRRVQDDRGAEFPAGDFVEDVQMQKAIEVVLEELGQKPSDVSDYQLVFDLPKPRADGHLTLAKSDQKELERALLEARRGDKPLTAEQFERLLEIVGTIDPREN
ncbi:MAG: S41 family peptidase, partial [Planctomycetes bacterium]|nr:S41 family peptidase [Planctomycetota bacterium]